MWAIDTLNRKHLCFHKKTHLLKENVEDHKYDCFETFETFIIENNIKVDDAIITDISEYLETLKENYKDMKMI